MDADEKKQQMMGRMSEQFARLPDDVQDMIMSSDYQTVVTTIAKEEDLTINQLGGLEIQTTLVLLGILDTKDYASTITQELKLAPEKAESVVKKVNEKVFLKIRESLKNIYEAPDEIEENLDRDNLLAQIENPTKQPNIAKPLPVIDSPLPIKPTTIVAESIAPSTGEIQPLPPQVPNFLAKKLDGTTVTTSTTTDHSLPGMTTAPEKTEPAPKLADPYREPIG